MKQFRALLWKEWREGWAVMVPLWVAAPIVGALVRGSIAAKRFPAEASESMLGTAFLCFAAALVAGRLFASEGESGTLRFLVSQPVGRVTLWGAKLLTGAGFLAALYALWFAARGTEHQVLIMLMRESARDCTTYWANPQAAWWPLIAFGAALFLSTVLDNAVLAFVGGMVVWMPFAAALGIWLRLAAERIPAPVADRAYLGAPALIAVLATAMVFLALSYAALRFRAKR